MQFLHTLKTKYKPIAVALMFSLVFHGTYANAQVMESAAQDDGQPFSDSEEKARIVIFDWFGGLINIAQGVGWLGGLGAGAYGLKAAWDAYKEGQVRRRNEDWGKEFSRRSDESKLISSLKKDKPYRRFRIYDSGQFKTSFSHMMRSAGIEILPPDFVIGKEADDVVEKMSEQEIPTAIISSQQRLNRLLEKEHLREKLFNALKIGDIDGVKRILELEPQLINATDDNGDSLLHYIAAIGIPGIAGHLIEQGAVVNIANNNDHTPLMLAANADNLALFTELLAHQPYLTTTELSSIFHMLAQSRSQSSVSMMRTLLRRGLQQRLRLGAIPACEPVILPTTQNSQSLSGLTLLHEAVIAGNVSMVIEILNAHIIHVDSQDEEGNTALHYAVAIDNTQNGSIIAALLSHEANINITNNLGDTPLHNAVYRSNCTVLTTLLNQRGRNTNIANNQGNTPLFAACQCTNSVEIIQLLMPVSSLLNAQGQTPLHILAQFTENIEMLEAVINAHTIDLNSTDDMGNTPLHVAVNANNEDAVLALVSENADSNKANTKTGLTPKDIARERSVRQDILDILDRGEP